jgi:ATP adenylyltransferase
MPYIRSLEKPGGSGCFLCEAAAATTDAEKRDRLVLWTTDLCVVVINQFPYTNGHLLVSPRVHKAEPGELTEAELLDVQVQTVRAIGLLKKAQSPQGFNLGINLGRCAGAGVPGHLHQHIVPRWAGDVNFMSVVADIRIIPQAMETLYDELLRALK